MSDEETLAKFDRLKKQIQGWVLTGYPNPDRIGCSIEAVAEYANRASDFEDKLEQEDRYQHIMHCSPCYAEFLKVRQERQALSPPAKPLPRRVEKRIRKTLHQLEDVMKSVVADQQTHRRRG
jgi:hypothetical protein